MNDDNHTAISTLLEYVTSRNWAMEPNILQEMATIIERHVSGERLGAGQIEAITASKRAKGDDGPAYEITKDGRAIIPVSGVISKYARMVNRVSQPRGTSVEKLSGQLREAVDDGRVRSILLHIESPGGSIAGLADFAAEVYEASFTKPVVAYIDDLGASAAYWIASQANSIYANQTAEVGSIGVYMLIMDSSQLVKNRGIKMHILRSGRHKGVGAMGVSISEENLAAIQESVDSYFEMFIGAVLKGRSAAGLDEEALRAIADGRVFVGAAAAQNKLIDGIGTLNDVLSGDVPEVREQMQASAREAQNGSQNAGRNTYLPLRQKENIMDEKTEKQGDAVNADELKQAGADFERIRITAIQSALPGEKFDAVRTKAIAEGWSLEQAKAAAFEVAAAANTAEKAAMQSQLEEKDARLKAIAEGGSETTAAEAADEDEETAAAAGDDGRASAYTDAVERFENRGSTKAQAYREAAVKFPKAHKAWKEEQPGYSSGP